MPHPFIEIVPLPMGAASGCTVSFPHDADRNARFRARFPAARWSSQTRKWYIAGKTAAQRAALWAEEEEALGLLAARRLQQAEMDRAWEEADPSARAAAAEQMRRRRAEADAAEAERQASLDRRRYRPDEAMIERIVEHYMAAAAASQGRLGADGDCLRAFLRRGVAPGQIGFGPNDPAYPGTTTTITYLGDGRVLREVKYQRVRGRNGRWQEPIACREEMDLSHDLMEAVLSGLLRREFRPRSGFGVPKF